MVQYSMVQYNEWVKPWSWVEYGHGGDGGARCDSGDGGDGSDASEEVGVLQEEVSAEEATAFYL